MKSKTLLACLIMGAVCQFPPHTSQAQDIDSMPPVVVKTVPEAGSTNVAPGEMVIKVTFSKAMTDQSWSPVELGKNTTPKIVEMPRYEADYRTWTLKVKLEPGKTYGYWLNSPKFANFKDTQGRPAVPYLLTFRTKAE
jgi:RNA polymerase sigma-70 factor (ECF subfamily)